MRKKLDPSMITLIILAICAALIPVAFVIYSKMNSPDIEHHKVDAFYETKSDIDTSSHQTEN